MPEERGYQRQVAPGGPERAVLRSAESFGGGLGGSIANAGETLHQTQLRSYKLDRQENADSEAAVKSREFAEMRQRHDDVIREARTAPQSGAKGHMAAVAALLEKDKTALLDGITEDSVRRSFQTNFDEYAVRLAKSEGDFETGTRIKRDVENLSQAMDLGANRVRVSKGDHNIYAEELTQQIAGIYAQPGIGDDMKDGLAREVEQKLSAKFLEGMMEEKPAEAKAAIMAGQYNDIFAADQLEALLNGADVEIRRGAAAQERQMAQAKAEFNERLATVKALDSQGVEVPDETLAELEAAAALTGDQSNMVELQGIRANNGFARIYETATPVQREQRLAALQAKAKPNIAEQREIAWFKSHSGALDSKYNDDPFAAAQAMGLKPAPNLNMADPASITARLSWQRTISQVTRRPMPFLSKNELASAREQYQSGEGGQMKLLGQLDMIPAAGGARAAAAREIAPNDNQFAILSGLNGAVRHMASEGKKVLGLKGRSAFAPSKDNPKKDDIDEMVDMVSGELAFALRGFPGQAASVQNVAVQIAVGALAGHGQDGDDLNEKTYRGAVNHALGRKNGTGGLGKWNGLSFVIADGFTPAGFEAAIMRHAQANGKNPPVNLDGSRFDLKNATPVYIGAKADGTARYHWEVGTGKNPPLVRAKNGKAYVSEVLAGRR